ncbi:hypothetical protein RIB2604_00101480 [Aspergillus luchuensis]|uniref:Stress-response A/B barrel domain-containing protein n=1 Tax=Aspergillus kawachii TaxID=1069201 RepID=A0A146EX87_ASPKA|nr:hypothetical protein RIB2604_00101480 [Aspergillus luchuensis]
MSITHIVMVQIKAEVSPEVIKDNGITHAFVVHFASADDRDYYVSKDPAHLAFVKSLDGIIEKAQKRAPRFKYLPISDNGDMAIPAQRILSLPCGASANDSQRFSECLRHRNASLR